MKKILILFLPILILQSCGNNTETLLIRKWKTDEEHAKKELENTSEDDIKDAISGFVKSKIQDFIKVNVEFKKDKTVELSVLGKTLTGTWELIEESDVKEIKIAGKLAQTIRIESITQDKLILTGFSIKGHSFGDQKIVLVPAE